jgi:uncharacterized protein (UPF0332 family)
MKTLKPHPTDWNQVGRFLAGADKKLVSARKILAFDEEASLQQAYEAMLKASLGFLLSHGFRVRSLPGHHVATIEFVQAHLPATHAPLLSLFDRLRRKRNAVLYDDEGFVSRQEAQEAIRAARDLIRVLRADIESRKSGPVNNEPKAT